uniref:Uncharacterized protein n=1 Tax=Chromera velia CCMP2878 TaxID=1169474 RepID=A0A0G4HLQ8_9ALVE|eukprot:Cvel_7399.t1-p1 / transcript=Cvel_7399.t1 / gene=Cvel_7399 / organism=Chromera_velia_CCMP2878 / gene_product=hypothetical protein / transcript_product=hypothetical protein / location=Cvel_scaffold386:13155-14133(-) / protein_length=201 / sequence_SO=supercontig / SO=protein_coding / is_pseudo=false
MGVSGTDLKMYTSNFISKMLFISNISMSNKVYQYEKGLPEDVQKEVKRKKSANFEAAVGAAFEALLIVPHPSVSFAAAATHLRTLFLTEAPLVTRSVGGVSDGKETSKRKMNSPIPPTIVKQKVACQTGVKSRMSGPRRMEREEELTEQQIAEIESAFATKQVEKEEETESKKKETQETTWGALLHKLREVEADPTLGRSH